MTGIYTIIGIVMLVFGILQIVLFFKLWGMTNDVGQIKGLLSNLSTQNATAAKSSHDLEQTSSEQKVVGKWPVGTLVVHTATIQQMRIKEITPDHKYVCTQGNLDRGPYAEDCLTSYEDYVTTTLNKNNSSSGPIIAALIAIVIIAILLFFTA